MIGIKALLVGSTLITAGLAQVDPLTVGGKLAAQSATGILGIVAVACVMGLVKVYKAKEAANDKYSEKLVTLIEKQSAQSQAVIDGQELSAGLMVEVKDSNNRVAGAMENNAIAIDKMATHCASMTRARTQ